ncbi:MAG: response regulator [Burkholderiales bacterium]|nr:response regulator [Burkholderiales bacterium]
MTTPAAAKVLLIDDHQITRSLLRAILREAGYLQFREAVDGESGIRVTEHFAPDLICLDVQMPGRNGVELLGELKALAPNAKVVMVTANNDRDTVVASVQSGASGYIVKPFNAATVIKVIERALGHAAAE